MNRHIHPIQCIIPPHMIEEIESNGTEGQKEIARRAQAVSRDIRDRRVGLMAEPAAVARVRAAARERVIYDAARGVGLPGQRVRGEGDVDGDDEAVNEAYNGAGATYDLYKDVYERDSLDGDGMRLDSTVHYREGYDNAFWNGQQMVYGDGDEDLPENERLFNRFTVAMDIVGHELTHGVVQFSAGLVYQDQPGALNESFADVFGSLVKQRALNQTVEEADWLIGAGLFTSNVNGQGIRSLKAPGSAYDDPVLGKDPQPGHLNDYVETQSDHGGVHINSGIPNRAFYVTARELGGRAWERAGRIWYRTLTDDGMTSQSDFQSVADLSVKTAGDLYGRGSREQQAVEAGWREVGIQAERGPGDGGEDEGDGGGGNGGGGGKGRGCALGLLYLPSDAFLRLVRG
jgi:Zn-dependent metalloprotease